MLKGGSLEFHFENIPVSNKKCGKDLQSPLGQASP